MDALYFGALVYAVGGLILYARYFSGQATDLFWIGVFIAGLFVVVAIWSVVGSFSSVLMLGLASVLSNLFACVVVRRFTGFGVCLLTCNIYLVMGASAFFHDLAGSLNGSLPLKVTAYTFMLVALLVMAKEAVMGRVDRFFRIFTSL